MITSETLCRLFPKAEEIPPEQRLAAPIHQTTWLVDGELRTWSGNRKTVLSPVCVRLPDGSLQQLEIGSYPVMGENESDQALDAAVRAFDSGRGEWPTKSVADRIDCMQDFVKQMVAQRRAVSQLIMWEIGKSLADSEKEFERTVDYIKQTLAALKDLDNNLSRFIVVEGTFALIGRTPLGVAL
jgi:acyl-CoA reductase-like NAD-dependent aldehyde dehydrogenase